MENKKTTRRQFLKTSAASMAGMAGILAFRQPPVFAGNGEMKYLGRNYFIKEFDQTLRKQAKAFSKEFGVKARIDTVQHKEKHTKLAAEVHSQAGHDLVLLRGAETYLFKDHYVDVSPATFDLLDVVIQANMVGAGILGFLLLVWCTQNKHAYFLACTVRQCNYPPYHLVCLFRIHTQPDVNING